MIVWAFFLSALAWSKDLVLVTPSGGPALDYTKMVDEVRAGDEIYFQGSTYRFQVQKVLGQGKTTKVLLVVPVWPASLGGKAVALRVPLQPSRTFHRDWNAGIKALRRQGVRVPAVYRATEQFALVEYVKADLTATQLFYPPSGTDLTMIKRAEKAFYEFVHSTRNFSRIADLRPAQMVYNDQAREWVLLDSTKAHEYKPWRVFAEDRPGIYNPFTGFFEAMEPSEMRKNPSAIWKTAMDQRKLAIEQEVARIHRAYPFRLPIGFIECVRSVVE